MTSASELFYTRRSRVGRAEQELGLDSFTTERSFRHRRHRHNHNHYHNFDGCDPLLRSPHVRHLSHRSSHSERAPVWLDQGSSQNVANYPINTEISRNTNRPSLNRSERLPGAVLLARARLLERLRDVSLSGNRRSARASSDIYRRENIFGDELRLVDAGDWGAETSAGWSAVSSPFPDLNNSQTQTLHFLQEGKKRKPPGLTQEALDCLHVEVFNNFEIGAEGEASNASLDCSVCLESFVEGDELIHLPCNHKFHSGCLDPWVQSCRNCPYCRRDIVVTSHKTTKRT